MTPATPLPVTPGQTWRNATAADAAGIAALVAACNAADGAEDGGSAPDAESPVVAERDGRLAAAGWLEHQYGTRWLLRGGVHPDDRRSGLGSALLAWLSREARARVVTRPQVLRVDRVLRADTPALPTGALAAYERAGLRFNYVEAEMQRALSEADAGNNASARFDVQPWSAARHAHIRNAYNDAFATRGFGGYGKDEWPRSFSPDDFAPQHSYVALLDGNIAGFLFAELRGDGRGWIDGIGVRPKYRGNGAVDELLLRAFASFARAGLARVVLRVNVDNPRAVAVYRRHGFAAVLRHVSYVSPATG